MCESKQVDSWRSLLYLSNPPIPEVPLGGASHSTLNLQKSQLGPWVQPQGLTACRLQTNRPSIPLLQRGSVLWNLRTGHLDAGAGCNRGFPEGDCS